MLRHDFFFRDSLQIDAYAIFNDNSAQTRYIFFERREATAKIEFEDNFQMKATTNLALCRRAVCSPFCSATEKRPAVVCRSLYMRVCMRGRVCMFACIWIDCTLPVNWCTKIVPIPEHKMHRVPLVSGWYVAGKIGGLSD